VFNLSAALLLIFVGCTGTGHLQDGEYLYAGAKIKLSKPYKTWDTKLLKTDLKKAVILPRPNKKIAWMRPKLAIYNAFKNRREKSIGNFIANQFGEEPVLFNPKIATRQRELLTERAANDGFFNTKINSSQKTGKHTIQIIHEVQVNSPREFVNKVTYPSDSSDLELYIAKLQPNQPFLLNDKNKSTNKPINASTSLSDRQSTNQPISQQTNQPYYLEALIAERQRLGDTLHNHGWYYFSPDNLIFEADTLHPKGDLNLTLKVKTAVTQREKQQYRLATITVYPDYDLAKQSDSIQLRSDTLILNKVQYVYQNLSTNPQVLNQQIAFKCGAFYSNNDYQTTIYRLLNLNLYKFINIRFEVSPLSDSLLDARIYLTPYRPRRVDATLSGVFSPSFYYGVLAGAAYNHRNLFRGAEALRLSLNVAYLRTDKSNFEYQDFLVTDATAKITLPRFLFLPKNEKLAYSTTQFNVRHETNWFKYDLPDLEKFRLSFQRLQLEGGYMWKNNRRGSVVQALNPLNLGFQYSTVNKRAIHQRLIASIPYDTTGTLLALLNFLEYKPNYTFTLDERLLPARRYTQYFRQRIAGQVSGFTRNKFLPSDYQLASPFNLFMESDYRQYQKTGGRNVLALRVAVGAGIPLRRNGSIALLDRYVVGGASSVRAFAPRTLGPGSQPRDTTNRGLSVGKYTGNVLIESSLEYRMPLGRYPELAFFVDAGNVWLTSGTEATEASKFRLKRFYKELAIGTGVGLRVNLGFFILRLDVAVPITKPYLAAGERFVGDDLRFGNKGWRKENLNWNFSFGYPF
jgi:outer membrane protein insertion porin family